MRDKLITYLSFCQLSVKITLTDDLRELKMLLWSCPFPPALSFAGVEENVKRGQLPGAEASPWCMPSHEMSTEGPGM